MMGDLYGFGYLGFQFMLGCWFKTSLCKDSDQSPLISCAPAFNHSVYRRQAFSSSNKGRRSSSVRDFR